MPTIVSAADITTRLEALTTGSTTREVIEDWAFTCIKAHDTGDLRFAPASDQPRLWRAITYLSGVALRVQPDQYLHSQQDIVAFRQQFAL